MKDVIIRLFKFELMQKCWGRKWIGGTFYLISPRGLQMGDFWSDKEITSCQSITLKTETFYKPHGICSQ
jgi:hypothetical protein